MDGGSEYKIREGPNTNYTAPPKNGAAYGDEPIMHQGAPSPKLAVRDSLAPNKVIQWDPLYTGRGGREILIGFRKLDDMRKAAKGFTRWQYIKSMVWLNGLAVSLTRPYGVTSPNGDMCHAELMIPVRSSQWVRFSINKKQFIGRDDSGAPQFEWGTVHATVMGERESEWRNKYCFLQFELEKRENVQRVFEFLVTQANAPFNYYGYIFNNFFCCARFGTNYYSDKLRYEQGKWYCTEIIHAAMQCGAGSENEQRKTGTRAEDNTWQTVVLNRRCNNTNPNDMFDRLSKCCNVVRTMAPNSQSVINIEM